MKEANQYFENLAKQIKESTNVSLLARIESVNSTTMIADVKPLQKDLPIIQNVPIAMQKLEGYYMKLDLSKGDIVLVVFSNHSLEGYLDDGKEREPLNSNIHSLDDAIIVGVIATSNTNPSRIREWKEVLEQGPQGEPGPQGLRGEQGIPGEKGEKGDPGPKGDKGDIGPKGDQGIQGPKGKDGYTPVKGIDYFDGEKGDQGIQGIPGKDGYTPIKGIDYFDGEKGEKGDQGERGISGEQGPKGDKGDSIEFAWNGTQLGVRVEGETSYQYVNLKGDKGDQGLKGDKGDTGLQGPKGDKGEKGDTGTQGIQGPDGRSIEYTWNGTQLGIRLEGEPSYQYVNLKGAKGDKGDQGIQGIQGPKGDKGAEGIRGPRGYSLEYMWDGSKLGIKVVDVDEDGGFVEVGQTPTGERLFQFAGEDIDLDFIFTDLKGPKGDKGDKGDTGSQGPEGKMGIQGLQGIPGLNGKSLEFNWNGTQLGIRLEGQTSYQYANLKGDKGDKGNTGDKGEPGEKGPKGDQGIQGNTGENGKSIEYQWNGTSLGIRQEGQTSYQYVNLKGDKGDTGSKGDTGDQGPRGLQGTQGPKGDQGIQGEKGEKGDKGEDATSTGTSLPTPNSTYRGKIFTLLDNVNGDKTYVCIRLKSGTYKWEDIIGSFS